MLFQNTSSAILIGFGFGGSLLALFLRVGGGIFTKAADVGADLVGKVEAGIPEDDPRNPATIADNVGDNVGDCAGMAADLFESYEVTLVASIILGVAAFNSIGANPALGLIFPLAARAIGVIASIVGVFAVKAKEGETNALKPINRGFLVAGTLTLIGTLLRRPDLRRQRPRQRRVEVLRRRGHRPRPGPGRSAGSPSTSPARLRPVKEIAESAETGPATVVLAGTASGMESSVYAVIAIAIAIGVALALGGGNLTVLALPRRPHRHGHARHHRRHRVGGHVRPGQRQRRRHRRDERRVPRRAGADHGQPRRRRQHHQGRHQGLRHRLGGHRRRRPVRQLHRDRRHRARQASPTNLKDGVVAACSTLPINVADPKMFIGLLIGGAVPFLFSALAIRAVGRTAGVVVQEVRNQFADGKIMTGEKEPDYGPVIDICTAASLRELATPALLAVLTPVIIGFGIDWKALGAFLAAVILVGQLMANYLSNAGGAWDNAKKYIEDGNHGGKGSDAHKAAVIGDTVGDPFKDTAGPALNPLIKVMNLVSLLDAAGDHQPAGQRRRPLLHRRRRRWPC